MTPRKQNIVVGFDMDGVIIDHTANKLLLAKKHSIQIFPKETHPELLQAKFTPNEYLVFRNELYGNSALALSAPLMEGAEVVLAELQNKKIHFVLVTLRTKPEDVILLLKARGLWGNMFCEQNTFFVKTAEEKNSVGLREGVTHFFDDEQRVLRAMPDIRERYLFDSFRQFNDEKEFERVFDWEMIRGIVLGNG